MVRSAGPATVNQRSVRRIASWTILAALARCASRAGAQPPGEPEPGPAAPPTRRIVVSLPDRKLALLENDRIVKIYSVAVGAPASPSPDGEYRIARRLENPTYYHSGMVIAPGPANPLGTRWIGLNVKGFGIHGTNRADSIGKNASHGCLRLRNRDIEDLFSRVKVGDRVSLIAVRNEEVARLFGSAFDPGHTPQTVAAENENVASADAETPGQR